MKKHIICIAGRTGSGKSTLARLLVKEYGLTQVKSYTTREARQNELAHPEDCDHIFVDQHSMDLIMGRNNPSKDAEGNEVAAYTKIGPYEYCTTWDVLEHSDIYVIDPVGICDLKKKIADQGRDAVLHIVYVVSDRRKVLAQKRNQNNALSDAREKAEDEQFTAFEDSRGYDVLVHNNRDAKDMLAENRAYFDSLVQTMRNEQ